MPYRRSFRSTRRSRFGGNRRSTSRRRVATRRSRRSSAGRSRSTQTVRIVLEQPAALTGAFGGTPETLGLKQAPTPRRGRF